jgi:asparagine synthase (glutamine-hydrolysing)
MSAAKRYLSAAVRDALCGDDDLVAELEGSLPAALASADQVTRAQHFDIGTLLVGYLLSSQGDRMAMAHSVENRVPFLDHGLVEHLGAVPSTKKLEGFVEKEPLRRAMAGRLPRAVLERRKFAYTAPALEPFASGRRPEYVSHLLDRPKILDIGLFDPDEVRRLVADHLDPTTTSHAYVSDFVAVLTTQLLAEQFFTGAQPVLPTPSYRLTDRCSSEGGGRRIRDSCRAGATTGRPRRHQEG